MFLLVCVVEKHESLPDVLEALAKVGVTGATVIESSGMGRVLADEKPMIPLSWLIGDILADGEETNRTIFTIVFRKDILHAALKVLRKTCGRFREHGTGVAFSIPLLDVEGIAGQ